MTVKATWLSWQVLKNYAVVVIAVAEIVCSPASRWLNFLVTCEAVIYENLDAPEIDMTIEFLVEVTTCMSWYVEMLHFQSYLTSNFDFHQEKPESAFVWTADSVIHHAPHGDRHAGHSLPKHVVSAWYITCVVLLYVDISAGGFFSCILMFHSGRFAVSSIV